jgi:hypothetical protein
VVVVVDADEVSKLQVTGSGSSLGGNTLHSTSITEETVGVVVNNVEAGLVEGTGSLGLSNSETNSVTETLTKRTSCNLNTGCVVSLRVTRENGVDLLHGLSIFILRLESKVLIRGKTSCRPL